MTDYQCFLYADAFISHVKPSLTSPQIALSGDLRSSTPRIMRAVHAAAVYNELTTVFCDRVPSPALALYATSRQMPSIMVTGSHIPDDRNGIKFNTQAGEILKDDEIAISEFYNQRKTNGHARELFDDNEMLLAPPDLPEPDPTAGSEYLQRFTNGFPGKALQGITLVLYEHSTVGRDLFAELFSTLGAEIISVGRSDTFIPVDTEAVDEPERLAQWVLEHNADALISADGDCDRPLLVDNKGHVVRGDILGVLVGESLGADAVATPISCNTVVEKSEFFSEVVRTCIGSPYVIAGMNELVKSGRNHVIGYEANGGFLTASDFKVKGAEESISALPTRDAALPLISILFSTRQKNITLNELCTSLPPVFTASGLIRDFPNELGKQVVDAFQNDSDAMVSKYFGDAFGALASSDFTDGVRFTFKSNDVVHLRPSGNAPEFRCYTESDSESTALTNNDTAVELMKTVILNDFK